MDVEAVNQLEGIELVPIPAKVPKMVLDKIGYMLVDLSSQSLDIDKRNRQNQVVAQEGQILLPPMSRCLNNVAMTNCRLFVRIEDEDLKMHWWPKCRNNGY